MQDFGESFFFFHHTRQAVDVVQTRIVKYRRGGSSAHGSGWVPRTDFALYRKSPGELSNVLMLLQWAIRVVQRFPNFLDVKVPLRWHSN